jgi:hypothetical protein
VQTPEAILERLRRKGPTKKKQHFSPQFYLRGFATLAPREEIWTYDVERGEARGSLVQATAYERYLYSVTLKGGEKLGVFEDFFADVETKASPVLTKLLVGTLLSDQERMDFASFMASMYVRTDAFRMNFAEIMTGESNLRCMPPPCGRTRSRQWSRTIDVILAR